MDQSVIRRFQDEAEQAYERLPQPEATHNAQVVMLAEIALQLATLNEHLSKTEPHYVERNLTAEHMHVHCAWCKEGYAINTYRTRRLLLTYCTVACAVRAGMAEQEAEQQLEEIIYYDAF